VIEASAAALVMTSALLSLSSPPAESRPPTPIACEASDLDGCVTRGLGILRGEGAPADAALAARHFEEACRRGSRWGCVALADAHANGTGVPRDPYRAQHLCTRAIAGSGEVTAAFRFYQSLCDASDPFGCRGLGLLHSLGLGAPVDLARATQLFQQACDLGDAFACSQVGTAYKDGQPLVADKARAAELFDKGCQGGCPEACTSLAELLTAGDGAPANQARAAGLLRRACDGFDLGACFALARRHESGNGVPKSPLKAAQLYGKASATGSPFLCRLLGLMYKVGAGVPVSKTKGDELTARAARLYDEACRNSLSSACEGARSMRSVNPRR
jgi:uncharacterized protein